MSAYKVIKTEIKNLESLKKALADLGLDQIDVAPDIHQNTLDLEGYNRMGGVRKAVIRIPACVYGGYEDTGFSWNGSSYDAHISTHDGGWQGHRDIGAGTLKAITQAYAVQEVTRQARLKGYSVKKIQDGKAVRLQLVKF